MSNAVLYLNPEAFDTSTKTLMGRHSAGESFLRGYLRHADVADYHFWNVASQPVEDLKRFVETVEPVRKKATWYGKSNRGAFSTVGVVNMPTPNIAAEAWARRPVGDQAYAICGITHTTATDRVMDMISNLLVAPVQPWDALICTSRAVRDAVEVQLEATTDYLSYTLGANKLLKPRIETVPLGINAADFVSTPAQKREWREKLGIAEDTIVALYVGRFSPSSKMNHLPMATALERAAALTGKKLAWVVAGWSGSDDYTARYHKASRDRCPSIQYIPLDGRLPDVRFSVWAVGDIFLSLSDNVQETFGLTPVEAMAAGMPNVVSDWNGYRDTVRHGIDGFRIATYSPRPGTGEDLAYRYANSWTKYDHYVAAAGQATVVDIDDAAAAIANLANDPELRARMGQAARERAVKVFDWTTVIKTYQDLWADQNRIRLAARRPAPPPRNIVNNPWRMDPYTLFASYPTEYLSGSNRVHLKPGVTWDDVQALIDEPMATIGAFALPPTQELQAVFEALGAHRQASVAELTAPFPAARRNVVERGILWLAKYGLAVVLGRSDKIAE